MSGVIDDPSHDLFQLKEAISETTWAMHHENNRKQSLLRAQETDDKLGWTMRFLRSAEKRQQSNMLRCARAYPELAQLVDVQNPDLRCSGGLTPMKEHAISLTKSAILEKLQAVKQDDGLVDAGIQRGRRSRIQARLRKLIPGNCSTIAAIKCSDGSFATDSAAIAEELKQHWAEVFKVRCVDEPKLAQWLAEEFPEGPPWRANASCTDWFISALDIGEAINKAPDTAPGPDGIPYKAWKRLGLLGSSILHKVAKRLVTQNPHDQFLCADPLAKGEHHGGWFFRRFFLEKIAFFFR